MRNVGNKTLKQRSPLRDPGSFVPPPPPPDTHFMDWYNNRRGFGQYCDAGYGVGWTTYTVNSAADTNTGSGTSGTLQWCLAKTGKTIVVFDPTIGSITDASKSGYQMTDDTLLDGYGWHGTFYGSIDSANCDNVVVMFMSVTQPFLYNASASGGMFTASNCPRAYFYRCTAWDSGDIIMAGGAYQLSPGGSTDKVQPYYATVDQCLWGPNPGNYAMMAPIKATNSGNIFTDMGAWSSTTAYVKNVSVTYGGNRWYAPQNMPAGSGPPPYQGWGAIGYLNGIDNDYKNGKGMNCAFDHQAVDDGRPLSDFALVAHITMIENVLQGIQIRNGKDRDEYVDLVNNVIAKFGTAYDYGGPAIHNGAGSAADGGAYMNIEGNVYIYYEEDEQFLGFMDVVADAMAAANPTLHIQRIHVTTPRTRNTVIKMEGSGSSSAKNIGHVKIANNWLDGGTPELPKFSDGFNRTTITGGYTLPTIPDRSVYANAQALVHKLCDDPATKVGNPWSTVQPPSWRDVHTGSTFPKTP